MISDRGDAIYSWKQHGWKPLETPVPRPIGCTPRSNRNARHLIPQNAYRSLEYSNIRIESRVRVNLGRKSMTAGCFRWWTSDNFERQTGNGIKWKVPLVGTPSNKPSPSTLLGLQANESIRRVVCNVLRIVRESNILGARHRECAISARYLGWDTTTMVYSWDVKHCLPNEQTDLEITSRRLGNYRAVINE